MNDPDLNELARLLYVTAAQAAVVHGVDAEDIQAWEVCDPRLQAVYLAAAKTAEQFLGGERVTTAENARYDAFAAIRAEEKVKLVSRFENEYNPSDPYEVGVTKDDVIAFLKG